MYPASFPGLFTQRFAKRTALETRFPCTVVDISPIREACKDSSVRSNEKRCYWHTLQWERRCLFSFSSIEKMQYWIFWLLIYMWARGVQFSDCHLKHFCFWGSLSLFRKLFNHYAVLPRFFTAGAGVDCMAENKGMNRFNQNKRVVHWKNLAGACSCLTL